MRSKAAIIGITVTCLYSAITLAEESAIQSISSESRPMLAISDSFVTFIDNSTSTLPIGSTSGVFYSANCSGLICIVAGYYGNSLGSFPLLASSVDGGSTWTYTIDSSTPTLPTSSPSAIFNNSSCFGVDCTDARLNRNNSGSQDFFANTINDVVIRTISFNRRTRTLPPGTTNGYFNSTSCSGFNCVAAGYYNTDVNTFPLLANSTNGGLTWTYSIDGSTPRLPANTTFGTFSSASCSELNCIAVGVYNNGFSNFPLLANSTNGGVTWTYRIDNRTPRLPRGTISGAFNSASCSGYNCIAAGGYSNDSGFFPLLANSTDGGLTWTYSIDSSTPILPSGDVFGQFFGTSITSLLWPPSLKFLQNFVEIAG